MKVWLNNLDQHISVVDSMRGLDSMITSVADHSSETLATGGTLFFCGNGGSAADSQHIASELTGRFVNDRRPLAALALTTDSSALTCIANDYSFDQIFARQVRALGKPGDVLFVISTSGNSTNLICAAKAAREVGMKIVGLLGNDGGHLFGSCDYALVVGSTVTARIQEAHIIIGHTLCELIENSLDLT